ncbi:hypothetical protein [Streptomyces sp. CA2R101]|uniref:hypothetical protein n=1 Tax=Streptomyces sp. CA2R101 TaxID=3120152 RepID=UPI00300B5FEA
MSPKNQSTAARKARSAAREGAKYPEALRGASPGPAALDWDDLVVSALSAVVAEHGVVPVRVIWTEDVRHSMVQRDNGVRWGVRTIHTVWQVFSSSSRRPRKERCSLV